MKKNVANNVDSVSFMTKMTKWPVQKQTLILDQHENE